jgi:tetratricopeptide (TPR) repeat protein
MSPEIHAPVTDPTDPSGGRRLDSWKEIAAFFQRDTRTVRRWEQTRHLPVHRVPGRRGYVFAYVEELNQWLRSADAKAAEEDAAIASLEPEEPEDFEPPVAPAPTPSIASFAPTQPSRVRFMVAAGVLLFASAAVFAGVRRMERKRAIVAESVVSPADLSESAKFTLRGRYYWDRRTEGGLQQALDAYTQAVVHDNNNARAYAGLAETYDLLPEYGKMSNADAYPRAIAAANRAISLDPSLAEAHRALAFALFYWNWDVNRSLNEFHTALQLDPQDFETHHWLATSLLTLQRGPESLAEIQRARELQPASRSILADQALINFVFHRDREESIATLRELERTDPDFVVAPRYLASIFHDEGNYPEYIAEATRAAEIAHDANLAAVMQEASDGYRQGGTLGMLQHMKIIQEQQFPKGQISAFDVARTCVLLGDKPCALHYLQAAFAAHDYMMLTIFDGQFCDLLKDDPAFRQLQDAVRHRMTQSA